MTAYGVSGLLRKSGKKWPKNQVAEDKDMKKRDQRKPENWINPLQAVRQHCFECMGEVGSAARMATECHSFKCWLWPLRLGMRPKTAGKKLYNFPDKSVYEIEDVDEAIHKASRVKVGTREC
jgi:hypothetical protein